MSDQGARGHDRLCAGGRVDAHDRERLAVDDEDAPGGAGSPDSLAMTATFFAVAVLVTLGLHVLTGGRL